jgi:DtxR family Mn-dependent transcriptional regulator
MEDYLECILLLEQEKRVARVSDISAKMSVRKASVVSAVAFLQQNGLLAHERYGYITLTETGRAAAARVHDKNTALYRLLVVNLKIDDETAKKEAGAASHNLSETTVNRLVTLARTASKVIVKQAKKSTIKKKR